MPEEPPTVALTETQHRILAALSRPASEGNRYASPATNQEIGEEVFLSVDAVKAHLRTLYRKFGIEDLPQNQKRARLVELVLEGGLLEADPVAEGDEGAAAERGAPSAPSGDRGRGSGRLWPAIAGVAALVALVLAVLALTGAFAGEDSPSTGVAAYRTAVKGYCRLALSGGAEGTGGSQTVQARGYLEVIETMRGRLEALPPPAAAGPALDRFREGLATAADFNAVVAQGKLRPGGAAEASAVAELTFAAGQVQAGALGYELGPRCVTLGDLVARSAINAASP